MSAMGAAGGMKSGPTAQAASGRASTAQRERRMAPCWTILIDATSPGVARWFIFYRAILTIPQPRLTAMSTKMRAAALMSHAKFGRLLLALGHGRHDVQQPLLHPYCDLGNDVGRLPHMGVDGGASARADG